MPSLVGSEMCIRDSDNQYKVKPKLISKYINKLTENKLNNKIVSYIRNRYDLRIDLKPISFNYLKDKKNPSLEETTKNSLIEFEKSMSDVTNFEILKSKETIINDFRSFWKEKLDASLAIGKKGKKTSWDLIKNMYRISLLSNDFKRADTEFYQLEGLEVRGFLMSTMRKPHQVLMNNYSNNIDANGIQQYADSYKVEPYLASINTKVEKENFASANDLIKEPGYIVTKKGEKKEGEISLIFSPRAPSQGGIVDISVGPGKSLTLSYINEKNKKRSKSYKGKSIEKFVIDNKIYEPVIPKKDLLGGAIDVLEVSLSNSFFMELIHTSGELKLFQDQMRENTFYLKTPDNKKAFPVNTKSNWSKYLGECKNVNDKINNSTFKFDKANIILLTDIYNKSCK